MVLSRDKLDEISDLLKDLQVVRLFPVYDPFTPFTLVSVDFRRESPCHQFTFVTQACAYLPIP